jgi:molybdopterin-guanine dinucleotide biosynthesis protein A
MSNTGIILSGGKSLRMGQDKGLMAFEGKPMIQHVIDHIEPLCDQILISANKEEYNRLGYPVIKDDIRDIGPAGGIISCLPHARHEKCIIISCDLPLASTSFIQKLIKLSDNYEITLPEYDGNIQPLCGIYQTDIYERFQKIVQTGQLTMKYLVGQFNLNVVHESLLPGINFRSQLRNINYKDDLSS